MMCIKELKEYEKKLNKQIISKSLEKLTSPFKKINLYKNKIENLVTKSYLDNPFQIVILFKQIDKVIHTKLSLLDMFQHNNFIL